VRLRVFTLAALLALAATGCSTTKTIPLSRHAAGAPAAVAPAEDDLAIIDAHTHTDFTGKPEETTGIPETREEYFRELKEAHAVGAIAHVIADEVDHHQTPGDVDLRALGVMHCAGAGQKPDLKAIEAGLKSRRYGCIKIYLGYIHQWASDAHYQPLYRLAEKYDVAVVFHTGDTYAVKGKVKYSDPLTIDEVAVDHPRVRFVIAHCGNPWIQSAAEVAYKNPNVWLDGSAFLIGNVDKLPAEKVDEYMVKPLRWIFGYLEDPTKLMFGSDWPLNDIAAYARAFKRAIPREHWKAVFHDNAVKVFKLKPSPGPMQ
jgi:hypothetical protein